MTQQLSKFAIGSEGIELSDAACEKFMVDAERLLHHSNLKEHQVHLMRAAALWNIKTKNLAKARSKSYDEYCDAIGIGDRQRRRYVAIGSMMFDYLRQAAKNNHEPLPEAATYFFTQKDIADAFEGYFTNGHVITLTSLANASRNLELFQACLRGEADEREAYRLLEESNVVAERPALEDTAHNRLSTMRDFHAHMREIAKEKGFRWNKEKMCFENVDGSPLREDQRVELTTRESGLEIWNQTFKEIRQTKKRVAAIAKNYGEFYTLYDRVPDTNFHTIVTDIARSIRNEIDSYEEMLDCLLSKDFERLEELAKVRADVELLDAEVGKL